MLLLYINFAALRAITTMTTCSILTTARLKQRSAIIRYISEIFRNIFHPILKKSFAIEWVQEAEEIFLNITSEKLKSDYAYLSWLARCFIMNGKVCQWSTYLWSCLIFSSLTWILIIFKARLAWELYLKMETSGMLEIVEKKINACLTSE